MSAEILAVAGAVEDVCKKLKQSKQTADQTAESNTVRTIDWSSQRVTDALAAAGKVYTGQQVSNALGSLNAYRNTWYAAEGGNIEFLTTSIVEISSRGPSEQDEVIAVAEAVEEVCTALKQARNIGFQTITSNNTRTINWTAQETIDALAAANKQYTGQQASNALGSINQYVNTWYPANSVNLEFMTVPIV